MFLKNHVNITCSPYSYDTLPIFCYSYNTPFMFEHQAKWLVKSERAHQNNSLFCFSLQHCICNITFLNYKKSVQLILPSQVEIQTLRNVNINKDLNKLHKVYAITNIIYPWAILVSAIISICLIGGPTYLVII